MEKFEQYREETAKKLKDIKDHEERRQVMDEIRETYTYRDAKFEKKDYLSRMDRLVNFILDKPTELIELKNNSLKVNDFQKTFNEFKDTNELSNALKDCFLKMADEFRKDERLLFRNTNFLKVLLELVSNFPELKEVMNSEEIKDCVRISSESFFENGRLKEMFSLLSSYNIPPNDLKLNQEALIRGIYSACLGINDWDQLEKFFGYFPKAKEDFQNSSSCVSSIKFHLENGDYGIAATIADIFEVPTYLLEEIVIRNFVDVLRGRIGGGTLSKSDIENYREDHGKSIFEIAVENLEEFDVSEDIKKQAFEDSLSTLLRRSDLESVQEAILYFGKDIDIEELKKDYEKLDYLSWLSNVSLSDIGTVKKIFYYLKIKRDEVEKVINSDKTDFDDKFILNTIVHPPINKEMYRVYQLFGYNVSEDLYTKINNLYLGNGEIDEELVSLGVTKNGEEGFRELETIFTNIKVSWLTDEPDLKSVLSSELVQSYFKNFIRYKVNEDQDQDDYAEWGNSNQEGFEETIKKFIEIKEEREINSTPEYMTKSPVISIDVVDEKEKIEWSEHFLSKYGQIVESIKSAEFSISDEKKPLSSIASEVQVEITRIINSLNEKRGQIQNEKAKIGIEQRVDELKAIDIRSIESFQNNFTILTKFKELHPILRKVIFIFSLMKNPNQKEKLKDLYSKNPDLDSVTTVLDFVDHITNKETMSKYFTDKKAKDSFKEILGTKTIQEELVRVSDRKVVSQVNMEFIPMRNILTEFSGHIADACWASTYESILQDFPNFSSVVFLKDPGQPNQKVAGACLLIETESDDGERLLVIRGLNPLQNIINSLSVKDFLDKFTGYIKEIAVKDDRKVALVIDSGSGKAGTNRPNLYEVMKHQNCKNIVLKNKIDTEFNGYDIRNKCVLVE